MPYRYIDNKASFYYETKPTGVKGRGSNMKLIDDALEDYWLTKGQVNKTNADRLLNLLKACATWLKKKEDKKEKGFLGKNELFIKRKNAIYTLGQEALELSMWLQVSLQTPGRKAELAFHKRKLESVFGSIRFQSVGLDKAYQFERTSWLKSGKTGAFSGSSAHDAFDFLQTGQWGKSEAPDKALLKFQGKKFSSLKYNELVMLSESEEMSQVNYLKKGDRFQFLAVPDGMYFYDISDNNFDAHGNYYDKDGTLDYMYAIDRYGNLFVRLAKNSYQGKRINHSTFNAGADVICAGMIDIKQGKLIYIDNASGHYKPNRKQLHEAICLFHVEGIYLRDTLVKIYEYFGNNIIIHQLNGEQFQQNINLQDPNRQVQ